MLESIHLKNVGNRQKATAMIVEWFNGELDEYEF